MFQRKGKLMGEEAFPSSAQLGLSSWGMIALCDLRGPPTDQESLSGSSISLCLSRPFFLCVAFISSWLSSGAKMAKEVLVCESSLLTIF